MTVVKLRETDVETPQSFRKAEASAARSSESRWENRRTQDDAQGRDELLALMDQLEAVVMKRGWPVPFTAYYLVNHEQLLRAMDRVRASLLSRCQDDRLLSAFGLQAERHDHRYGTYDDHHTTKR